MLGLHHTVFLEVLLTIVSKLDVGRQGVAVLRLGFLLVNDVMHVDLAIVEVLVNLLLGRVDMLEALVLEPTLVRLLDSAAHVIELEVCPCSGADIAVFVDSRPQLDPLLKRFVHSFIIVSHNGVLN